MIEEVHILVGDDREFISPTHFSAWQGFTLRGRDVQRKTIAELQGQLPQARREVLVFGGVANALAQLAAVGCSPEPLDYPASLATYLDRPVEVGTLADIRRRFGGPSEPVFVKPRAQKRFTGHVVASFRDLLRTVAVDGSEPVYTSPVLQFVSEWRCYVHKQEVVAIGHYKGDPLVFPDAAVVRSAVAAYAADGAPVAYGLDFGVHEAADGRRTAVVEANDMISLGSYGVPAMMYATMIEDRWLQLVRIG